MTVKPELGFILGILCVVYWGSAQAENAHFMEEEACNSSGMIIHLNEEQHTYGYVKLTRYDGYSPNLNCLMKFYAPTSDHHIMVRFRKVDIWKPEKYCTTDKLLLYGNVDTHEFCGSGTPSKAYISAHDELNLQFSSGDHSNMNGENDRIGYDLYYTSQHYGYCDSGSTGREFRCRSGACIPRELTCNGKDNCGDLSDERSSVCGLPAFSIIMISLVSVLVGGCCFGAVVYYCIDSKKSNRRPASPRENHISPYTVSYQPGSNQRLPPVTGPMEPPPYTEYLPEYSEEKKGIPPPMYDNQGYTDPVGVVPLTERANQAPVSGSENQVPVTGSVNQAPVSGSVNQVPVTGSVNQAPVPPTNQGEAVYEELPL